MSEIILASASPHRAAILRNAGLAFRQMASSLDERAVEAPLEAEDVLPEDRAVILAEAKATDVSESCPSAWVVGCDQILALDGEVLHKPEDMEAARRRILALSGRTHMLYSAVVLIQDGKTLWRHVSPCSMTLRSLTPKSVGQYLASAGEEVLTTVGAYQLEGLGVHLFEKIDGDFFSILGLPLLPLLKTLRDQGAIDG